ncbi:MAG: penicillin-binding protein 2 [Armatimonadota bacterium]|nr:penicillin-binding protein 2 [Armatimonadota bacterium]
MSRQQTVQSNHLSIIKPRATLLFIFVAVLYASLAGRLVYLQAARHTYFQAQADLYRVSKSLLPARRGLILDRNGEALATNIPAAAVYADPQEVADPAAAAALLAPILHDDPARLQKLLTPRSSKVHYVGLKRHFALPSTAVLPVQALTAAIKRTGLAGIYVVGDTSRSYPNGSLAAQVLGFTNGDGIGIAGLEHSQEALLRGHDGKVVAEIDKDGRFLPGTTRHRVEAENGADIVTTIDMRLQGIADDELAKAVQSHHAEHGVVVVMDPQTGEILALSQAPSFNPNAPRPPGKLSKAAALTLAARWKAAAVSDLYEPGSTLKTITASAILQEQGLGMMDKYVYCSPTLPIGKHVIHEAADALTKNLGDQNLRGILRVSSNVGMAQFGIGLGAPRLYKYEQKFGFLDTPGSGLPGEAKSHLLAPDAPNKFTGGIGWSKIQLANISFGQGISLTPLQLATAYCAVANGGTLMHPHILRAVRRDGKETLIKSEPIRRVLDPQVAATVRSMLGTVVQSGTGRPAQIADFSVGGKTGSAQWSGPRGYEEGKFVASFVGIYPLSHPRLVILCAVFQPQGIHWGASVAAPVVHNIAREAMLQMQIAPDAPGMVDWDDHLKVKMAMRASGGRRVVKRRAGDVGGTP